MGGESFAPNVAGPDGTGGPGSASSVSLETITVGYPSSDVAGRSDDCLIYSVVLDDQSEVGQNASLVGKSGSFTDGSDFGANSNSRTYTFANVTLDPSKTYYFYFDIDQYLNYEDPSSYSGGHAWDADFFNCPGNLQFQVTMGAVPGPSVESIVPSAGSDQTTNANNVAYTVTFSEAVSGVDATDFALASEGVANGSIGTPTSTDGGITWTVPVATGSGAGTLALDLVDNDSITDSNGVSLVRRRRAGRWLFRRRSLHPGGHGLLVPDEQHLERF